MTNLKISYRGKIERVRLPELTLFRKIQLLTGIKLLVCKRMSKFRVTARGKTMVLTLTTLPEGTRVQTRGSLEALKVPTTFKLKAGPMII
jgi:hypothetical protein